MISMKRRHAHARAGVCVAMLCALGVACLALADPAPGAGTPQPPASTNPPAPAAPAQPAPAADDSGCGTKGADGKIVPATPAASGDVPPAQGPPPEWTCEAATVTIPPVWSGNSMTATWVVKNTGTGDLIIKLKGG